MSNDPTPRQPKGIPVGGQYAAYAHAEPGAVLAVARHRQAMAIRRDLLRTHGFVPAATMQAMNAPTTTEHREEWWNRNFVAAEYRAEGKSYPQMPDDDTPSMHTGQAMSGKRRTHRMNYGNEDIQLRMPSATAIRRFSGDNGNPTFDVPVSVALKGGAPVQGWVRVTKSGPHSWETTTLGGNGGPAGEQVAEAVAAVLESRRVTMALARVPDLLAARKAREAAKGAELSPVSSSWIDEVGFDENTNTMATRIGNKLYGHKVSKQFFEAVKVSERPGQVFNKLVRAHQRAAVVQCGKCLRFTSALVAHTCPTGHKPESGIGQGHVERARMRAEAVASSRSAGVSPVVNVAPAPAPVNTAPSRNAQPVPTRKTGLPAARRVDVHAPAPTVPEKNDPASPRYLDPEAF
ncbi:hypothetical protein IV500_05530 [Paeniglutamicibacter antarcticus]|uniref:Uncharacterized protein n=1 Tax=Arthrobacter terrae TaxID=2935737 RepID=A0A931G9P1_9MICC|nr:hypothetical protein [Arthrobacter terrae]MBG0738882.1 hypothetical protein [Arthrobacter terrae]